MAPAPGTPTLSTSLHDCGTLLALWRKVPARANVAWKCSHHIPMLPACFWTTAGMLLSASAARSFSSLSSMNLCSGGLSCNAQASTQTQPFSSRGSRNDKDQIVKLSDVFLRTRQAAARHPARREATLALQRHCADSLKHAPGRATIVAIMFDKM